MTKERDLELRRGQTFSLGVRWETERWIYAQLSSISRTAPVALTCAAPHQIPDGWEVAVIDARGLLALNAKNNPPKTTDMRRATVVSPDRIEFNEFSTAGASAAHIAGSGYLAWLAPHTLLDYVARMTIKDRVGGAVLHAMTSAPGGGIIVDDVLKVIEVTISASTTEGFGWSRGVYDLELESPGGVVTALLKGSVTVDAEITTP